MGKCGVFLNDSKFVYLCLIVGRMTLHSDCETLSDKSERGETARGNVIKRQDDLTFPHIITVYGHTAQLHERSVLPCYYLDYTQREILTVPMSIILA